MTSSVQRVRELRAAARIAIIAALMVIAAFVASKAARDAILLSSYSIEMLPLFVGLSAALSLPIVLWASRLFVRYSPGRLLPALNIASALLLVGEWLLAHREPRVAAAIVFLHLGTFGAVLVSGFWSIINERFDVRTAKRYVGRIGVGATLGGILGGVITERTAVYLDANAILLVLAALQIGCAIVLRVLAGKEPVRRPDPESLAALASVRTIARTSMLRNLALILVLGAVGAAALDYVFKAEVVAATDNGPLRMFALYHLGTSIVTALLQLLVAQRALRSLGIARSVGTLPLTLSGFSLGAVLFGGLYPAMIARGAEAVMRSSLFRAGYELLFTPLPDDEKRSAKVVLDVGAERIGDLLGAQLVALVVFAAPLPRTPLLVAASIAGVLAFIAATRLPRAYTSALAHSLVEQAQDGAARPANVPASDPLRWSMLGAPSMSETGADLTALSLLDLDVAQIRKLDTVPVREQVIPAVDAALARTDPGDSLVSDPALERIRALRSRDPVRVRDALAGEPAPDLVTHILPLVAWNEVAPAALSALLALAPKNTGAIADALLDQTRDFAIRRRLPAVLTAGEPTLATWTLWRALGDRRFEVRYRCGRALLELRAAGHEMPFSADDVFALVERELSVERAVLKSYRLLDSDPNVKSDRGAAPIANVSSSAALAHVFNMLALVLPHEPVRIAFQSLQTGDHELRATALEYLESALPPTLGEKLWPIIDVQAVPRSKRSAAELSMALRVSQPLIEAKLAALRGDK
jgi:ATP:ADP antiporter, AAA family